MKRWALIILLLTGCSGGTPPPPAGWQLGYSTGVTLSTSESGSIWSFKFPAYPDHVNMVTKSVAGLTGSQITAVFQETESDPVWFWAFDAGNTCNPGSLPQIHFYFQRAGDDFSGAGDKQYYRWWSKGYDIEFSQLTAAVGLTPGDWWSSVYGVNATAQPLMFQQAKDNASSVGVTFGGGCFAGHGVAVKGGSATLTLKSFNVK